MPSRRPRRRPDHSFADELQPWEYDERFEAEYQFFADLGYVNSLDDEERERYERGDSLHDAQRAAIERAGLGAGGISPRSRSEMWRRVLSLPFDMLGDRPLWITLTYPKEWRRWVPDGRALEAHRRAFGERWRRGFREPIGFWTKEFQLADGRPHLHLLMKGPETMSDQDYRSLQERTRLAKANERALGKYEGRAKTDIIGMRYGGQTAMELRRWWAEIVTGEHRQAPPRPGSRSPDGLLQPRRGRGPRQTPVGHRCLYGRRNGEVRPKGAAGRLRDGGQLLRPVGESRRIQAPGDWHGGRSGGLVRVKPAVDATSGVAAGGSAGSGSLCQRRLEETEGLAGPHDRRGRPGGAGEAAAMVGRFSGAEEGQLVLDGFSHKEAAQEDAEEEAQEDVEGDPVGSAGPESS